MGEDRRSTVLIVEDDGITALCERECLESSGYSVITVRSGEEAALMAQSEPSIDLVLMDIDLGVGIDGIEAASLIMRTCRTPVVFISAHTDAATLARLDGIDAYGYVTKDSGDAVLTAAVGMALRRAEAEKEEARRLEDAYARQVAECEMRVREAHHRVRNNIASITSILSMQLDTVDSPAAASALQDAIGRIAGMGSLYDLLASDSRGAKSSVKGYIDSLIDTIVPIFPALPAISIEKRVDDVPLDPKRMFALGIIVNELLTNAMKYAFEGREKGSIAIDIAAYDESVILTMRDDGNGLPGGFDPARSSGLGLSLISMLLDQFGGTLSMRSDEGTTSTVLIKAPGLAAVSAGRGKSEAKVAVA